MVFLSGECRSLRRALRPLVWVVLEEVALDAEFDAGGLVARTSARQVAEHLGVNPSTAAEALRVLARRGLVSLEREKGPAGRFGLSVYQLRPPAGLSVVQPGATEPPMVSPSMVSPSMVRPDMDGAIQLSPCVVAPHAESSRLDERASGRPGRRVVETDVRPIAVVPDPDSFSAAPGEGSRRRPVRPTASPGSSRRCPGQTALDLGLGSS